MKKNKQNNYRKIKIISVLAIFCASIFILPPQKIQAATLLSDDFTGTTIDTNKWQEIDTAGSGGTSGNIQQNGSLTTADGYAGSVWGTNALISVDTFDSDSLEISAVMTNNSDQLLGYGDHNFQSAGTKAYILDMVATTIYVLVWNNGSLVDSNFACGTFTDGATYKIKIISGGFEVYKNGALQCTQNTAVSIDDEKIFLQSSTTASVFDDVLVVGNSAAPTAPGAPTGLTPTAGNTQVSLSWTAPVSNGGSAITDYLVEYKLASEPTTWTTFADGTSTNTTATVTSLSNGSSYNFRVSAINAIGTSTPSSTATTTPTAPTAPGAPTGLSGVSGNTQVSLSWTAPVSNGGSAITDYLVEYKLNSEPTTWSTFNDGTSTSTSTTVTGLTNDLIYNFRVSAINAIGTSTPSSTANGTPGQAIPLTIDNIALWLDGSDASSITESSGIVSQVNDKSGNDKNATASDSVRPTLVSSIQNGRSILRFDGDDDYLNINSSINYRTIFVVAKSDDTSFSNYPGIIGDFTGTSPNNGHIVNGVDGTTKLASATSNYSSAYRNGTLIAGSSGHNFAPLNEFWIGAFELPLNSTNTTSAIGMINGGGRYWDGDIAEIIVYSTTLDITDRAIVENYLSVKWGIAVAGPTAPDAPTDLGASKGNTLISLSWTAPADNGGSAITDYLVEYKLSSEPTTWTTFADGTSTGTTATVTGLTNDLSYDFRVKAVNAFGTSSASNIATKTPGAPTVPDAPTIGTATAGNTEAIVTFSAPADNGGSAITSYTATSSPGGFTSSGASSPLTVTGLTNGVEYTFTVTATNAIGTSVPSSASNAITPSILGIQLTDNFAGTTLNTTKWLEIDPTGRGGLAGKVLQNGTLSIADSYTNSLWGSTVLQSQDSFSASSLEISAVINTASNPLIGYGDYAFGVVSSKAYLLYAAHGANVLALSWDGVSSEQSSCGTTTSGATYKMKIISGGFEVYKNDVLQCTHNTAVVVNDKPIFLQNSAAASTFDDVLVYGTKTTAVTPGQVAGLSSSGMNKQVLLNWDIPSSSGYTAITDYLIEYKLSSSDSWTTFSDGTSQNTKTVVTGLTNDLAYDFRVSATNSAGNGTPSTTSSATPSAIDTLAFVITGESNSGGIGLNSDATAGEVASRSAVQIMNLTSGLFGFENLDIGTNNLRDHDGLGGYYDTSHGFELQLANSTEAHAFPDNEQVYLVKTGHGGSQVSQWDVGQTYWTKFLQRTAAAKTQLDADRKWVVWMSLGINDAISGTALTTWKNAMVAHINKIKNDLPGAIIIMTQFQSMTNQSGYATYNAIMSDIAYEEANVYVVDSTGAALRDTNHWSYAGLKTVASSMATTTKNSLGLIYPGKPTSLTATPASTSVALSWTAPVSNGGSAITDYLIEYKTSAANSWSTFSDGTSTSTSATVTGLSGSTAYDFRVSTTSATGTGNTVSTTATTTDGTAPSISAVVATPSTTSVTITWTTDESSSSIVDYGLTNSYGTSTVETDTDPRVTSHSITINNLVTCTTYNYRVKSNDASANLATGSNNTFTTTGCTGNTTVSEIISSTVTTATGAVVDLESGTANFSLNVPASFKTGIDDAVFQIKQLSTNTLLLTTGSPSGKTVAGSHTYDLSALSGVNTTLTTFDELLTLTISYTNNEINGLDETTLALYFWNDTSWEALNSCTINSVANNITCTTDHFTTFGVFGSAASTPQNVSGGTTCYQCSLPPIVPVGGFKVIANSGKNTTTNRIVKLDFNAGSDVKKMAISLTNNFININQENYSPTKEINLCPNSNEINNNVSCPDGDYIIYVKFYTEYGVASEIISTSIRLTTTPEPTKPLLTFTKDLRLGAKDNQVKVLQQFLNRNGFKLASKGVGSPGKETDYFGSLTASTLTKFQEANKNKIPGIIKEKGFIGPLTRQLINASMHNPQPPTIKPPIASRPKFFSSLLSKGMQNEDVRQLQKLLATKPEIYPEKLVTGFFGSLTEKAVQAFQIKYKVISSKNDPGFGVVGPQTRTKLQEVFGN